MSRCELVVFLMVAQGVGCFNPNLQSEITCNDGLCPPGFVCDIDSRCRRLGDRSDASLEDAVSPDSPFGAAVLISEIPGYAADPELSANALELYYRSGDVTDDTDIMVATRETVGSEWSAPQRVAELSTSQSEFDPRLSPDGLTIWFTRGSVDASDVRVSTRASLTSSWAAPSVFIELLGQGATFSFSVTAAGNDGLFSSSRLGGNVDIYSARLLAGVWGLIEPVDELNSSDFDGSCELSPDGLTVYFDSDRSGRRQLYHSSRASLDSPFSAPEVIAELTSGSGDEDPTISSDGRTLLFSSDRDGSRRLFESTR